MRTNLITTLLFFCAYTAYCQPGIIDTSYNSDWYTPFLNGEGPDDMITLLFEQSDGKILVGGSFNNFSGVNRSRLARLNADGSFDLSFDAGNYLSQAQGTAITSIVERNDKYLIGGTFHSLTPVSTFSSLIQLNYDGSIDSNFNIPFTSNTISSLIEQPNGKILVGGNNATLNDGVITRNVPCRLNYDGSIDPTFDVGSGIVANIKNMILQPDGKLLIMGSISVGGGAFSSKIVRLNSDGSIDNSFFYGIGAGSNIRAMELLPDGKIVVGGTFSTYNGQNTSKLIVLNSDGTLNSGFNTGSGLNGFVNAITILPNGEIIAATTTTSNSVYNGNAFSGLLQVDTAGVFNVQCLNFEAANTDIQVISKLSNGTFLVGGGFSSIGSLVRNRIAKVDTILKCDSTFYRFPGSSNGSVEVIEEDIFGKTLIAGSFQVYNDTRVKGICRLNSDGTRDTSFSYPAMSSLIRTLKIYKDSMILVGGGGFGFAENTRRGFFRLKYDGSLDTSFVIGSGVGVVSYVTCIEVQPDNKIILGGDFTTFDGTPINGLVRLNEDGTIDNSFNTGSGFNGLVRSIHFSPLGQIYVGGDFTEYNGITSNKIVCLNQNGTIDQNFDSGTGFDGSVYVIKTLGNRIVMGGSFENYDGSPAIGMIIIEANGNVYNGFTSSIDDYPNTRVSNMIIQPDNKILFGGTFYITSPQNAFARCHPDGSLDNTFSLFNMPTNSLKFSCLKSSGQILIGGQFNSVQNHVANDLCQVGNDVLGFSSLNLTFESIENIDCVNGLSSVTAVASNGLPPYSFSWQNSSNPFYSTQMYSSSGMKTCTVTDSLGHSITESIFISSPSSISMHDMDVFVVAEPFRPGFDVNVWMDALNLGCLPMNGQLQLIIDSELDFISSTPLPSIISGDTLIWDYPMLYYDSAHFIPHIILNTPVSAQIGDTLFLKALISPILNDTDTINNSKQFLYTVVNGYDPNDKNVYPQGKCDDRYIQIDQDLFYTIRFQNTGNAEAINIVVVDSLDPFLDISTVQLVAASHDLLLKGVSGSVLRFEFDNIQLLDSLTNEPLSHGYAIFKIRPTSSAIHGSLITNKVDIYFDYNPPITTNSVTNTIYVGDLEIHNCDPFSGLIDEHNSLNNFINIFPNPFNDKIHIELTEELTSKKIELVDLSGKVCLTEETKKDSFDLDLSGFKSGVYFVRIESIVLKVIKK